jgi:hypothetical protein
MPNLPPEQRALLERRTENQNAAFWLTDDERAALRTALDLIYRMNREIGELVELKTCPLPLGEIEERITQAEELSGDFKVTTRVRGVLEEMARDLRDLVKLVREVTISSNERRS